MVSSAYNNDSSLQVWLRTVWRVLAFVGIILTLVYFVPVIAKQSVYKKPLSPEWAYVLVVAAISFILLVLELFFSPHILFAAHWIIAILYLAAFGIFAKMFLARPHGKKNRVKYADTDKMKVGVWILFSMTLLFAGYALYNTWAFFRARKLKRLYGDQGY